MVQDSQDVVVNNYYGSTGEVYFCVNLLSFTQQYRIQGTVDTAVITAAIPALPFE